ncbi:MAG: hypothetical protein M1821_004150 [Bathelium mastoideum]|nr:MAG: hypothetical protein M1821_004150 [Bathelium mastoideum]
MASIKRSASRSPSVERASGDSGAVRNPTTGRPIRKSAGKRSAESGFIDWDSLSAPSGEDEKESVITQSSESDGTDDDDVDLAPNIFKRIKRQRRDPTPTPTPPMSPSLLPTGESTPYPSPEPQARPMTLPPINLSINVAPNHKGPIQLQLDVNSLFGQRAGPQSYNSVPWSSTRASSASPSSYDETKRGFLSLAPEIRNQIYHVLLVTTEPMDFLKCTNFCRSSQLLSTCSQIYREARPYLYSKNTFLAVRRHGMRSRPFVAGDAEIGYTDFLRFLRQIGKENVGLIRDLGMLFEDAMPSSLKYSTAEERRFVHDDFLLSCLRNLARNAKLHELHIYFLGRKDLKQLDRYFLDTIKRVKADTVRFELHPSFEMNQSIWLLHRFPSKQQESVKQDLREEMTRDVKLYE